MATLVLLLLFVCGAANAIRLLKEGPMIDAEGREYKSAVIKPQLQARPAVDVQCTETSMIVVIMADLHPNSRLEAVLGEAGRSQGGRCRAVATEDNEYIIEAELQDCGSKLTVSVTNLRE